MTNMKLKFIILTVLAATLVTSCKTYKKNTDRNMPQPELSEARQIRPNIIGSEVVSPEVFVYKTRKDYSDNVPVIMDSSKTRIISYPAPSDLKIGNRLAVPTRLKDNMFLDNRGIGPNAVFLSYTYSEYAALESAPAMEVLLNSIIDKEPIIFYAYCGKKNSYKDIVNELNALIDSGQIYAMGITVCPESCEKSE